MIRIALPLLLLAPQAAAAAQDGLPERPAVKERLREILSSGEYATGDGTRAFSLAEWLQEKIRRFLASLARLGAEAPVLYWTIFAVLVFILLLIFAHAGTVVWRALRAARAGPAGDVPGRPGRKEDPRALLERAAAEAARGRTTEAIRLCHRAALLALDRRGLIRYQESLTSGDYRRQLQPHPRQRSSFDGLVRIYEPAFFGRAPVGPAEFEECRRRALEMAPEGRA